ncbi:TetR family transcriptional regulator [Candidatus Enterococcus ikei]|uniref:TetR/AcrR family transcriptional regulator n=1 Tax=Candidatus Enterococcus ikei TaxID=2815326 RepID=A0ABS3H2P0_9ENTE|nr:TetR/AcrR family transcriptional regulator [Enterococcus sp. DIV0869a]
MKEVKIDQQKYDRILTAALKHFSKYGYQKANTDEIASEAGVSKGLIFHYFGKKQMLYERTISDVIDFLSAQSKELFTKQYTDLVEVVVTSTRLKMKLEKAYPDHLHLLITAYAQKQNLPKEIQAKLSQYVDENMAIAQQLLTGIIEQLPIRKEIAQQDVVQLVLGVFNQISMESLQFLNAHPEVTEVKQMQFLAERAELYMDILQTGFLENKAEEK